MILVKNTIFFSVFLPNRKQLLNTNRLFLMKMRMPFISQGLFRNLCWQGEIFFTRACLLIVMRQASANSLKRSSKFSSVEIGLLSK